MTSPTGATGATGLHCTGCGRPSSDCPGHCTTDLDPGRFCRECGRRLAVQVFPGHVVARCPHGHAQDASHPSPA